MIGQTTILEKSVKCAAAVAAFTICKPGADDDHAVVSAAVGDKLIGVFQHATTVAEQEVRIMLEGISRVIYGGNVAFGDPLTSDANGKAVAATPAAGVNNRIIGFAMCAGVANDIGFCRLAPGVMQGA